MAWVHRTMFVAVPAVGMARALAAAFPSSAGMWTTPVARADSDAQTVSDYVSAGLIDDEFAALLPLTAWERGVDGAWVRGAELPGNPDAIVAAAVAAGQEVTREQVLWLFGLCDVSDQSFDDAAARRGVRVVQQMDV